MPTADFWDPENGSSDVVRHAPDDDNYHYPESDQLGKMRSGLTTVLIPRAKEDGRSLAFDGTKAGVVHVDPDAPDGGAVVDMGAVRKADMNAAIGSSRFPHQAYYRLGVAPAAKPTGRKAPPPRRENSIIGSGYIVPPTDKHGRQVEQEEAGYGDFAPIYPKEQEVLTPAPLLPPVPGVPQQPPQYQQQPQPQQIAPAHYPPPQPLQQGYAPPMYYPPPPPQPDPGFQAMLGQILGGIQSLSHRVKAAEDRAAGDDRHEAPARRERPSDAVATAAVGQPPRRGGSRFPRPVPIGQAPRRQERDEEQENDPYADSEQAGVFEDDAQEIGRPKAQPRRRSKTAQHVDEMIDELEPRREGIIVGFDTLKLKYVTGPMPLKAKCKVFFDFGDTGRQSAYYHDVVVAKNCIALVYDTRYEDGTQFMPPDMDEKIFTLGVPHTPKKEFRVSSMGFSFTMGVFDIIVLVNHGDENEEFDDES